MRRKLHKLHKLLELLSLEAAKWTGTSWAFLCVLGLVIVWLFSGPFLGFSNGWQLIMNTISSIVTFLMVFLLQRSQNKDALAMQIKLNEIVAALQGANNRVISVEGLSEEEIKKIHEEYERLAAKLKQEPPSSEPISTGDAELDSSIAAVATSVIS